MLLNGVSQFILENHVRLWFRIGNCAGQSFDLPPVRIDEEWQFEKEERRHPSSGTTFVLRNPLITRVCSLAWMLLGLELVPAFDFRVFWCFRVRTAEHTISHLLQ